MQIIVLSITQYKEKDGIINALSSEGEISFLARRIFDPKNQNAAINNLLTIADVELTQGKSKYPALKSCQILETALKSDNNLNYLSTILVASEACKKMVQDEDKINVYKEMVKFIPAVKVSKEPLMTLLILLSKLITISGYELEVNQCVFCGSKKDIQAFSFLEGGFVCKNCLTEETNHDLTGNQMLLLRSAWLTDDYLLLSKYFNQDDALTLINKYRDYILEGLGVEISSIGLLNK